MLRRVAVVRTDVSEELSASFIRVTKISELGITLAVTSNRRTVSVLTRTKRRNVPEDTILHSHRRENLKTYYLSYFHRAMISAQSPKHYWWIDLPYSEAE
jgi:hypothetical protein